MPIELPHVANIQEGNTLASITYNTGKGYFLAYRNASLIIECWGKGGNGANGGAGTPPFGTPVGGGGGGGGGYCQKTLTVSRGDVFTWTITVNSNVVSSQYSLNMLAITGSNGTGNKGGNGGAAFGGDTNTVGQKGFAAVGTTGGAGGTAPSGGTGGAGGAPGNNGSPGSAPGGGGGGGGSPPGAGAAGASARIKFSWA